MPIKIFFCYAREDEPLLNKLKSHLRPLERQGIIDFWYDRNISAGAEWKREIDKHLSTADIILLLVSPDFMESDYCYGVEMKRALERQSREDAIVIPIILRPCLWKRSPLRELQVLPEDGKPIMSSSWQYSDEAFFSVANQIDTTVEKLSMSLSINPSLSYQMLHGEENSSVYDYKEAMLTTPNNQVGTGLSLLDPKVRQSLEASTKLIWGDVSESPGLTISKVKKELNCKIVYYGIHSSGKTTNLHYIHQSAHPYEIGDMVSIDTETERTLYFDLLPLELGSVHGFRLRCQLYTIPGQILYQQTRASLLKGVSCVIFIADSQAGKLQENIESWNELQEQFRVTNKDITTFPLIMQWNNRSLPDALPVSILEQHLNPYHAPSFEADAVTGKGVIECLRAAINKTLMSL